MRKIMFVGTAGAGKTTLTAAFQNWMHDNGHDAITLNLDPGAEKLPYQPDVDIRDWVKLDEVVKEYGLGPNGAQIAAADMLALNMEKVLEPVEKIDSDYLLVDTPGQLELFAYRQSGNVVLQKLGMDETVIAFVTDPSICKTPSGFVSSALLFASVNFRFDVPALNVLTKIDTITEEELQNIIGWSTSEERLYDDLMESDIRSAKPLSLEIFRALRDVGAYSELIAVSSEDYSGMGDIYAMAQGIFQGGEDLDRRLA
ncbi:MAG: ATP/GTP-binding protein [Candidatus Thermoplasmatota archaeon]|nr:ATP/GTP-binding protein [Candidatus Thermoplasmatota archaeon]